MRCWSCNAAELIWSGDDDAEMDDGTPSIVSYLHCPACKADVHVYHRPADYDDGEAES